VKLIGVTGKTGAGKTTFSNMLANKEKVGVIHVDDILKEFKLKYFKLLLSKDKNGEKTKINYNLKTILYGNKLIFELFMRFRSKLVEDKIDKKILQLVEEGNEIIIIDDIFIKYMKRYKDLSKVYIVRRPFLERKAAIKERDDLTKKEIVAVDVAHHKKNYKEISKNKKIQYINNNGTQEELSKIVDEIYNEQLDVSIREKYKQNICYTRKTKNIYKTSNCKKNREEKIK